MAFARTANNLLPVFGSISPMVLPSLHIILHILIPLLIAWLFFRKDWKKVFLVLMISMLIDLDHLLADPIYDPNRCSIGFHPLHTFWAMGLFAGIMFLPRLRILGLGIWIHLGLDFVDCLIHAP